jgi:hypothetical protein
MAEYGHSSNQTSAAGGYSDPRANVWLERIKAQNEHFERWQQKFKCTKMESYYAGEQWEPSGTNYEPYTINLIFSTIQIKLPTLLFTAPQFHIKPKPEGFEYDIEGAIKRSQLREDLINTLATDYVINFADEVETSILDSMFRFGVIEVGYEADWVINPNADKPILKSDYQPYHGSDGNPLKQPEKLPQSERIYVKRVVASHFRVGGLDTSRLDRCNWCGYWEYVRTEDLKANKNLKNIDQLTWAGGRSSDFVDNEYGPEIEMLIKTGDLCKVWHIFDNRKKMRYLLADQQGIFLYEKSFERLPLFALRYNRLLRGWYPLPPVSQWKSPQDEYNESREQARNHRKRFTRKYVFKESAFTGEEEKDKLINGGDGTFVAAEGDITTAVFPIPNADLGPSSIQALQVSKDDFNLISATSEEMRGQADRTTATQANIINQKAAIKDSRAKLQVARWLQEIGREMLLLAEEKFTLPVWVKMEVPAPAFGQYMQEVQYIWHQITTNDLKKKNGESFEDDFNFEVNISLDSLSPVEADDDKQKFLLFISTLAQFPELSADPLLIRETAYRLGYKNEKVIGRMQQVAQLMLVQKLQALQAASAPKGAGGPGQQAQQVTANATGPTLENIQNQLTNQLGTRPV